MAEGIKISEMEQVATLEDGCCFPVVSNGENKKITQKNLYNLMTKDLQSQIDTTNNYRLSSQSTSFVKLGLGSANATVSVFKLWEQLYSKYKKSWEGASGCLKILWSDGEKGYVSTYGNSGNKTLELNDGTLIFTSGKPTTWQTFSAMYIDTSANKTYVIACTVSGDINNPNSRIWEISNKDAVDTLQSKVNNLDAYKLSTETTTMQGLGFTPNSIVSVLDLWRTLYSTYGGNGFLNFKWSDGQSAYISPRGGETGKVRINGGILLFGGDNSNKPYTNFAAIYQDTSSGRVWYISCYVDGNQAMLNPTVLEISTSAQINNLQSQTNNLQSQINNLSNSVPAKGLSKESANVMDAAGSIDFNTNKAVLQLPIYSKDATNQPTAAGAIWIQEVEVEE